jgi:hypothetical protein
MILHEMWEICSKKNKMINKRSFKDVIQTDFKPDGEKWGKIPIFFELNQSQKMFWFFLKFKLI